MSGVRSNYRGVAQLVRRYWTAYGGLRSVVSSPYAHLATLLLVISKGVWGNAGWWEIVSSILPNLLGFSLGGFAVFVALGSEDFRKLISRDPGDAEGRPSVFLTSVATFTHYVLVQAVALMTALAAAGLSKMPPPTHGFLLRVNDMAQLVSWAVGYWLFLYAVCLAMAALLALFRVSTWYDVFIGGEKR